MSLDLFWLRDESLEDSANLPEPHVLAQEIADDLRSALGQIEDILGDLEQRVKAHDGLSATGRGITVSDFLNLRDHVIVITGAASGMGRAIAQAASREGARLVLSDFDGDRLAATAGELKGEVRHLRADVTRLPEIDAVFALAEREFGRIDGLVTCAGIITTLPMLEVTSEEWDRVFAVNAKGTFFTVQAALRRMLPRRPGADRDDRLR